MPSSREVFRASVPGVSTEIWPDSHLLPSRAKLPEAQKEEGASMKHAVHLAWAQVPLTSQGMGGTL